ncbi:MAG TPA: hypothetical protein VNA04_06330 [Thermoanaerobaculia bacterium]|nr:hypothetical protein [Thermoanaerobaculia bacterium]
MTSLVHVALELPGAMRGGVLAEDPLARSLGDHSAATIAFRVTLSANRCAL